MAAPKLAFPVPGMAAIAIKLETKVTVSDLISILQQHDPRARVVIPDSDEPAPGRIYELCMWHVRACAIRYPHPDRAPRFAGEYADKNAVYLSTLPPPPGSLL